DRHRVPEVGSRCDGGAQLFGDHADLAPRGTVTASILRNRKRTYADVDRQRTPQRRVVLLGPLGALDSCGHGCLFGEQAAHARPQFVLDVAIEEVRHFGRYFHATSLSTRISPGNPSTRSAMMLRRISDVPPPRALPFERR